MRLYVILFSPFFSFYFSFPTFTMDIQASNMIYYLLMPQPSKSNWLMNDIESNNAMDKHFYLKWFYKLCTILPKKKKTIPHTWDRDSKESLSLSMPIIVVDIVEVFLWFSSRFPIFLFGKKIMSSDITETTAFLLCTLYNICFFLLLLWLVSVSDH